MTGSKLIIIVIWFVSLLSLSCQPKKRILSSAIEAYKATGYFCDNQEGNDESCVLIYNGIKYHKIAKYKLNRFGEIDSVFWYGNPLGVNKMSLDEYRQIFTSTSICNNMNISIKKDHLIDRCDTLTLAELTMDGNKYVHSLGDNLKLFYFH